MADRHFIRRSAQPIFVRIANPLSKRAGRRGELPRGKISFTVPPIPTATSGHQRGRIAQIFDDVVSTLSPLQQGCRSTEEVDADWGNGGQRIIGRMAIF
jgi:hypothetical protein